MNWIFFFKKSRWGNAVQENLQEELDNLKFRGVRPIKVLHVHGGLPLSRAERLCGTTRRSEGVIEMRGSFFFIRTVGKLTCLLADICPTRLVGYIVLDIQINVMYSNTCDAKYAECNSMNAEKEFVCLGYRLGPTKPTATQPVTFCRVRAA